MSDMKLSEAVREIAKFKTVFQSAEKLEEVLAAVSRAESAAGAAEGRKNNAIAQTETLNKEIAKLTDSIAELNKKRKQDILDLDAQYRKRQESLKSNFMKEAHEIENNKKALDAEYAKYKAAHDARMHDMQKEASEIGSVLQDLTKTREQLRKQLGAV